MSPAAGAEPVDAGWVSEEVARELPGAGVRSVEVEAGDVPSPPWLRERLTALSDRLRGTEALALRARGIHLAHRVFFRHIGLDPDRTPPPGERAALERLLAGGLRSAGLIADARLVAVVETGVGVWALDAAALSGSLGLRTARAGEHPAGTGGVPFPAGALVVADRSRALTLAFGEPGPELLPGRSTGRVRLYALAVPGVGELAVREALWTCATILGPH